MRSSSLARCIIEAQYEGAMLDLDGIEDEFSVEPDVDVIAMQEPAQNLIELTGWIRPGTVPTVKEYEDQERARIRHERQCEAQRARRYRETQVRRARATRHYPHFVDAASLEPSKVIRTRKADWYVDEFGNMYRTQAVWQEELRLLNRRNLIKKLERCSCLNGFVQRMVEAWRVKIPMMKRRPPRKLVKDFQDLCYQLRPVS